MNETVVITRHAALVKYLRQSGLVSDDVKVIPHASADDVRGKHVIGVLPLHLAAEAASVTEVPLSLPPELRGQELTLEQVQRYAGYPATYRVVRDYSVPSNRWDDERDTAALTRAARENNLKEYLRLHRVWFATPGNGSKGWEQKCSQCGL